MQRRRLIAGVAILVVVVLMALGIRSCTSSQHVSALKDYAAGVSSVIQRSQSTSSQLFRVLTSSQGQSSATSLASQLSATLGSARSDLAVANNLSPPSEMQDAQRDLVLALTMRRDAIANIATEIQPALEPNTSTKEVNAIATEMARLYASDAVYKDYVVPSVYTALGHAGISSSDIQPIAEPQFVPSLNWLIPSEIAKTLHTSFHGGTSTSTKPGPGTHGHELLSVSVNGTTLQTGSTNSLPADPTFTFNFLNSGTATENNVVCKVSINTSSDTGQTTVAQTFAKQNAVCSVTLSSPPPSGPATVTATVEPVPGEIHIANNTLTFPVSFQ